MTAADPVTIEICVESIPGMRAAIAGGATRIELCAALEVGGLTPSIGLMESAHALAHAADIPVFAMVRPRPGDFDYDADDLALAIRDACALVDAGADGLVFGTCAGGRVAGEQARAWIDAVRSAYGALSCTFHRAIDLTDDPVAAAQVVADLGFDRILTSGGAKVAEQGVATIAAMVTRVGDRLSVMAGSGVSPQTIPKLAAAGIREFHASASRAAGPLDARVAALGFATASRRMTDADLVAALRAAANATSS